MTRKLVIPFLAVCLSLSLVSCTRTQGGAPSTETIVSTPKPVQDELEGRYVHPGLDTWYRFLADRQFHSPKEVVDTAKRELGVDCRVEEVHSREVKAFIVTGPPEAGVGDIQVLIFTEHSGNFRLRALFTYSMYYGLPIKWSLEESHLDRGKKTRLIQRVGPEKRSKIFCELEL